MLDTLHLLSPAHRTDLPSQTMISLKSVLASFDEFLYFPSIGWNHSWERQQTLISAFCAAHSPKIGVVVAPTGLVDHAPWRIQTWRQLLAHRQHGLGHASEAHVDNAMPDNLRYVEPYFSRGTNALFAALAKGSSAPLRSLRRPKGRRLVLACYVNPLVESFLKEAAFTILDLAERRQANPALSPQVRAMEREWAARADLLVADNQATLSDYAEVRSAAGRREGSLIPQGFTPLDVVLPKKSADRPIAAYLGNLHSAIDYAYLAALIDRNPGWTFKLCGKRMSREADAILARPNVDYRGIISNQEIASFLSDASWGLIPYLRTKWTEGVFPTKLFEYLGHGLPVLSTGIPEVARFAEHPFICIADAPITMVAQKFDGEKLRELTTQHTWSARFQAYARAIQVATE